MCKHVDNLQMIARTLPDSVSTETCQKLANAAEYIKKLNRGLELYQKERDRFKHAHPELSGCFFLSGGFGAEDANFLPEFVNICPAYGCGWVQVYSKTDKTISCEGS